MPTTTVGTQRQLFIKMGFVLLLIFLLMLPIAWIQSLIYERAGLQREVEQSVAASWGQEQVIYGPLLCIPYQKTKVSEGKTYTTDHRLFLAPDSIDLKSDATAEVRKKGIFETVVFTSTQDISGTFSLRDLPTASDITYLFADAVLITGITDPTAITNKIATKWSGQEARTMPGIKHRGFVDEGFHTPVRITSEQPEYTFRQQFSARGTTSVSFLPTGKNSAIRMTSNWPSPSFNGRTLPLTREISDKGFTATWTANEYNRPFPDHWSDAEYAANHQSIFGVALIQPADFYQKNTRSAKYAILVITLSFLVFFFYEILLSIRMHPVQYIMVGLSLAIFYVLLLSFTEHIGFNKAYFISAAAVISLIAAYAYAIIKQGKFVALLTALFALLYGYIFILLQLEDYALLAGAIGLFFILAAVMLLSRKIDWYQLSGRNTADAPKG